MDQPAIAPEAPFVQPDTSSALVAEVRLLRTYLVATLTATVVVTFCFNVFLYRVDRSTRTQIAQSLELERNAGTSLGTFLNQVMSFGNTHPEVAQILTKYGIKQPASNAPVAPPAPGPGVVPKAAAPAGGSNPKK